MKFSSKEIAKVAIAMAGSSREEEIQMKEEYRAKEIITAAIDIGGSVVNSVSKIMERSVITAKRNGLINETHVNEGALIGATKEAIEQIKSKALGFNVGGKIGIAVGGEHLVVCIFLTIGMFRLDEVVIGLGHRAIPLAKGELK
ncbi:HutP family protein [Fusobacterium sp. PH5-44]|uniref:HutP family protein n=1 Tax=unclassified Fusobacterium TaxID=2648384 RepID=UPI003D247818